MTIFEYVPSAVPKLNKTNIYQKRNIYRNFQPNRRDLQIEKRDTQTKRETDTRLNWRLVSTVKSFCDKDTT